MTITTTHVTDTKDKKIGRLLEVIESAVQPNFFFF